MTNEEPIKSMKTVKNYCEKRENCQNCPINKCCEDYPRFWEFPEEGKKIEKDLKQINLKESKMENEKKYIVEYTETITRKKVFTKKEIEAAKEQLIKERILHSLQETNGETNLERVEKISQAVMNEFTEEEIMQSLEYLFYQDMSIREEAEILKEVFEEIEFRIVE